jgi:hypothetical protein
MLNGLYRNVFVYGQGECAAYLRESSGLTASDMTLVGFCLLSVVGRYLISSNGVLVSRDA